jgi:uncharacterized peroxidase-related enzyme
MPRIRPVDTASATGETKAVLDAVKAQIGAVPNILATFAQSPQVLEGYLAMSDALGRGVLPAPLREQIAVAIAGANACDYCASAHTALGKRAGVDRAELARNLSGLSEDARVQAALYFVSKVVAERGHVSDADVQALRDAEFGDAEIVEIVAHVGVNMFTNYFNHIAGTEIDFPLVRASATAEAA